MRGERGSDRHTDRRDSDTAHRKGTHTQRPTQASPPRLQHLEDAPCPRPVDELMGGEVGLKSLSK